MIIEPFKGAFWIVIAFTLLVGVGFGLSQKNRDLPARRRALLLFWGVLFAFFVAYRLVQSGDARYLAYHGLAEYNWWDALPLQLCYTSLILMPLALIKNWKYLLSFCFYITPLAAMMTLFFPDPLFVGVSLLDPQVFLFYLLHGLLVVGGFMLAPLGLFKPTWRMLIPTVVLLMAFTGVMHVINLIMRATVFPIANFYYTCDTADISLLNLCWNILPVPYLYEYLLMPIIAGYIAIVNAVYMLIRRLHAPKAPAA